MVKIWTNQGKNDDKIIAIVDEVIYKCNPKTEDTEDFVRAFRVKSIPDKETFGVPLSYIKEFIYQEQKNYIQIMFGIDSEEHLRIGDTENRKEIFEHFKNIIPHSSYHLDKYTLLRAGKKPLLALLVVSALFIWTLFIAFGMEAGTEYDVSGGHYNSFAGLVIMFASLGVKKVMFIFIPLMAIAILSFIVKVKNPPIIHRVIIRR